MFETTVTGGVATVVIQAAGSSIGFSWRVRRNAAVSAARSIS